MIHVPQHPIKKHYQKHLVHATHMESAEAAAQNRRLYWQQNDYNDKITINHQKQKLVTCCSQQQKCVVSTDNYNTNTSMPITQVYQLEDIVMTATVALLKIR